MLRSKTFFKVGFPILRFFGLLFSGKVPSVKQLAVMVIFGLIVAINFIMVLYVMFSTDEIEIRLKAIRVLPTFFSVTTEALNFLLNSKKIIKIFEDFCDVIERSDEKAVFSQSFKSIMIVVGVITGLAFFSVTINALQFLLTGETGIPIYIPEDNFPLFILIWIFQTVFAVFYIINLYCLTEIHIFIYMSLLKAFVKALRKKAVKISFKNESWKDLNEDVERFTRIKISFEEVFSRMILMKTLTTVVITASTVLQFSHEVNF